jgi:streptomycin 6-kinase
MFNVKMNLPSEFIRTIENGFGDNGKQFIANLPTLVHEASQRWGLTDVRPSSTLSYNFVAFAKRGDEQVVLKMGVPDRELKSEMAALRLFNGEGACRLIDYDEEKYWMLLERLNPGVMLSTLENDDEATYIAADVMQKIWRPLEALESASSLHSQGVLVKNQKQASGPHNFIQLSDWFDGLKRLRAMFNGRTGPLNEKLVERVERSVSNFFAENHKPVLMHGDFHHFNILSSERGWLVIDPKGVIGPAGYDVGPLLINPWGDLLSGNNYGLMTKRRIDILHERLGFERERIHEWGLAHAVLSAWWSIEDNGDWRYAADFAEMIAELPLVS